MASHGFKPSDMTLSASSAEGSLEHAMEDGIISVDTNARRQSRRGSFTFRRFMAERRMETIGIAILIFGIAVVVMFIFAISLGMKELKVEEESQPESNSFIGLTRPRTTPIPVTSPSISPVASPVTGTQSAPFAPGTNVAPVAPIQQSTFGPTYESFFHRLSEVVDGNLLLDEGTPQGMAYQWITKIDDLRWSPNHPFLVQRFALAAFYFATGGRRTTATWEFCSAVPSNLVTTSNAFSTRCVFADGETICANIEDFIHCNEYYDQYLTNTEEMPSIENLKKRWLSETSECEWYGVFCNSDGNVEQLSLPSNGLMGTLIPELSLLSDLKHINLRKNELSGSLPKAWETLQMQHVSLDENQFVGTIPWTSSEHWENLLTLDLAKNNLTGTLKLPSKWMQLQTLVLNDNQLEVSFRPKVSSWTSLQTLDLEGNNIGTSIPAVLGNCEGLMQLNLANSGMTGSIPSELGDLSNLMELRLAHNNLNETIPEEIWKLSFLQKLYLEDNTFSGTLSSWIGMLGMLQEFSVENSGLGGDIPQTLGNLLSLETAHFNFNDFEGQIPASLCAVPGLTELVADCGGGEGVTCSCCTQCCSSKNDKYECRDP